MTYQNKETIVQFGRVALLIILCIVAIITSAGVWNGVASGVIDSFYGWVAGLNLILEGFYIYLLYQKLFPKVVKNVRI